MTKLKPSTVIRTVLPVLFIFLCAIGFVFAPHDPNLVDMTMRFHPSSADYPFGTDNMGRCILSRLLYGGRTTLGIVLAGSLGVSVFGTVIGLSMGGSRAGKNIVIESLLNAVTAIPPIAYLIIFIAAWGNGIRTMLVAITASLLLRLIKLVRTRAEVEYSRAYVMCAFASGATRFRVLFAHILPNLIWDVIHFVCLSCADLVLSIVGFSFIGLGLGDNIVDWGTMVSESHHYIIAYPSLTIYPVLFIVLCTLSFNLLGGHIEKRGVQHA